MILGKVTTDDEPIIMVEVGGQSWPALIDSGFNGDLELPNALRSSVNPQFVGRMISLLAAGQTVEEDKYDVEFPFEGHVVLAEATFATGSTILIGTHFLRNYRLEINFVARTVILERLISAAA